ncbi:hypothetical protein BGX28_004033 [Mortierella sp. GBA30]|nr:hypothetical protein BGX28_004033 [Mortierella sp. GBA30]
MEVLRQNLAPSHLDQVLPTPLSPPPQRLRKTNSKSSSTAIPSLDSGPSSRRPRVTPESFLSSDLLAFPNSDSRSPYGSARSFTPFLEEMFVIIGQNEALLGKNVLQEKKKNKYRSGEDDNDEEDDGDDERQSDDDDDDDDKEEDDESGTKKNKGDPLAAQVWRVYSQAKKSLPNGQRLENLTWRMMAMSLHKTNKDQQQESPLSQPSSADTVSSRVPPSNRLPRESISAGSHAFAIASDTENRTEGSSQDSQLEDLQFSDPSSFMPPSLPTPVNSCAASSPSSTSSQTPSRTRIDMLSAESSGAQFCSMQQSMDVDIGDSEQQNSNTLNTGAFPNLAAVAGTAAATPTGSHPTFGMDPSQQNHLALYNAYLMSMASAPPPPNSSLQVNQQILQSSQDQFRTVSVPDQLGGGPYLGVRSNPLQMLGNHQQMPLDFSWLEDVILPMAPEHIIAARRFGYMPFASQNIMICPQHHAHTCTSTSNSENEEDESEQTPPTQCTNCNTLKTPLWRRDQNGLPLCNACGLFLKLHGRTRPLSLKTDVIKKRNRGGANSKVNKVAEQKASKPLFIITGHQIPHPHIRLLADL